VVESIGRYQVKEQVSDGAAGSAEIYRALDTARERDVALKILHPDLLSDLSDAEVSTRLRNFAEPAGNLNHASISRVRDVGFEDGRHYVVTDWVQGKGVYELIAKHGPMPIAEALRVVMDVLAGLGHAHTNGMLHKDVKLENFMLAEDGTAVLTDYGVCKDFAPAGAPPEERWSATVTALAPEVILGQEPHAPSDLYGVGIVLYELLTGDSAFPVEDGDDPWEVAERRVEHPPPRLPSRIVGVPPDFGEILVRALSRDPRARFDTANDFTRALIGMAVRYRFEIPDKVPLAGIPRRYKESRRTAQALVIAQDPTAQVAAEVNEETARAEVSRKRTAILHSLLMLGGVGACWWVMATQVAYVSVTTFPPGAEVALVAEGSDKKIALGETPVRFRPVFRGSYRLEARWSGDGTGARTGGEALAAASHLAWNLAPDGSSELRRTRIPLPQGFDLGFLRRGWNWLWGLVRGEEGPMRFRSQAVDPEGDRLLSERKVAEAARIYKARAKVDHELARLAADRLVEAAYLRRNHDQAWSIQALKEALHLDVGHARGQVMLGLLLDANSPDEALPHLRRGAQHLAGGGPSDLPDDPEDALAEVTRRRQANPEDPGLARLEAHLLAQTGQDGAARAALVQLAERRGWNRPSTY
jgi:serine/threonine protein kinase